MKYRIYDTFNRRTVSNHRSIKAAVIASDRFSRSVRKSNGQNSYIPTRIEYFSDCEQWIGVPPEEVHDAENQFLNR